MKSQGQQRYVVFFLAGFLLGVLYIYFTEDYKGDGMDFFSVRNILDLRYAEIVYKDYFWFLLKKRTALLLVLGILALALAGKYLLLGFLMLFGCSMGSMLSVLILRYGLKGILLFAAFIFPQNALYIPAVFGWVYLLSMRNEAMFGRRAEIWRGGKYRGGIRQIFLLSVVTIIGIILECYVNPALVSWCLKIF